MALLIYLDPNRNITWYSCGQHEVLRDGTEATLAACVCELEELRTDHKALEGRPVSRPQSRGHI